jgi:hypothetical protein
MKLQSNRDLYQYLLVLSEQLKSRGSEELSAMVVSATRLAGDIPITEFLGESRIALRRVKKEAGSLLNEEERLELKEVLKQLDASFRR